jgi:hypothetical protein
MKNTHQNSAISNNDIGFLVTCAFCTGLLIGLCIGGIIDLIETIVIAIALYLCAVLLFFRGEK